MSLLSSLCKYDFLASRRHQFPSFPGTSLPQVSSGGLQHPPKFPDVSLLVWLGRSFFRQKFFTLSFQSPQTFPACSLMDVTFTILSSSSFLGSVLRLIIFHSLKSISQYAAISYNMQKRRILVCSALLKLRNKVMQIYLLLVLRPKKSQDENYAKHNRTNEISKVDKH